LKIGIDPQEFKKLYREATPHRELAKMFNCGLTTIQNMRVELKLPRRYHKNTKAYQPKDIDEKRFRELYDAGLSYQEIGEEFGITSIGIVRRYVRVFNLPERDKTLMRINQEKFKKAYLEGCSLCGLSRDFRMNQLTTRRVIKTLGLPDRSGSANTIINMSDFEENDDNLNYDDEVNYDDTVKLNNIKKFFTAPTLRELEKRKRTIEMIRAETEYKNRWGKLDERK